MIQFLCPNGHKIHCSEDRAGKPAKCPKCGIKFRIPMRGDGGSGEDSANDGQTLQDEMASGSSPGTAGVVSGPATAENQIESSVPTTICSTVRPASKVNLVSVPRCRGSRFRISVPTRKWRKRKRSKRKKSKRSPSRPGRLRSGRRAAHAELRSTSPWNRKRTKLRICSRGRMWLPSRFPLAG